MSRCQVGSLAPVVNFGLLAQLNVLYMLISQGKMSELDIVLLSVEMILMETIVA